MFKVCERVLIGDLQWTSHINGMKHKRVLDKQKKLARKKEWEAAKEKEKESAEEFVEKVQNKNDIKAAA